MGTYCGKSCGSCPWKAQLDCPGCADGPGQPVFGDCQLAACCRSKRHETCDTCMDRAHCPTLAGKLQIAEQRSQKLRIESEQTARLKQQAPGMAKWLTILFWLIVPGELSGLMTQEFVLESLPGLEVPGAVLGLAVNVVYGLILLRLTFAEPRYRLAGLVSLAATLLHGVQQLLAQTPAATVLLLAAGALGMVGEYQELNAHADAVSGVNRDLSDRFQQLWKWYLRMLAIVIAGAALLPLIPLLGVLAAVVGAIGTLVVGIAKLVTIWQAAGAFREFDP